ncbi:uncharacterized protein LOC110942454 [Helianthus annuus]|uniref:uncharacterized protein LOC110942454 n=1 Tax=Helianthus annuus TaxID=4232 RepID=UPI001652D761|nr:uncharacterized protein LOC110942454 [Helianthus annuus]
MKEKDKIQLERKINLQILRSNTVDLSGEDEDEDEDNVQDTDYGKTTQNTLDRNNPIKEKLKMNAWDKIATWAYAVGLPFNAVRDESFQDMIHAIGEYGRGMPAPSYHNIRVTLMKKRLEETKQFVDSFRPHWEEYGCSILSDFWTDGKGRCLINFLVNCPRGMVFLKSIDASEHVKNADLIVKMINEAIEGVGEANIVQFITDNGSNFKAAGKILEEEHPKMFWTPCAAHCVNLMIQDIGEKIPKIKSVLSEARAIVVYIYYHGRILNMMRKLAKNKELHRSCVTRFATQFYTLQSIHENRHHIQVLFVSEEWRKSDFANKAVGKKVERIIAKTEFWDNVHLACQVLAPLVDVVRLVDTEEKSCMGYIYDAVSRAKEQIKKNLTDERLMTKLHSKKRNCLLQQKLNDLVFIQYNTRLQRRFNSLKTNKSLDPILLRDVDENDDWVIPTEIEHQDFVDGSDGLLWSVAREAMGGNEDVGPSTRSKRERYRDDDVRVNSVEVEDLDERLDSLVDVDSEEDFIGYD